MMSTCCRDDEALENVEEFSNIVEMEAGGGLVKDVERGAGLPLESSRPA